MAIVQWTLIPAQNHLPAEGYVVLEQGMNNVLKTLTPTLMISSLVLCIVVIVLAYRRKSRMRVLYVAAGAGLIVMIISTLLINAPINDVIDTWNAIAPPSDWQSLRDRWEFGHAIRSYVGLIALLIA